MDSTKALQSNKFWLRFLQDNYGEMSEEVYTGFQEPLMKETLDEETGLPVYIEDSNDILSLIHI